MFLKDTVGAADNADVIEFAHKNCHRPKYKCEKNANTGKNTLERTLVANRLGLTLNYHHYHYHHHSELQKVI